MEGLYIENQKDFLSDIVKRDRKLRKPGTGSTLEKLYIALISHKEMTFKELSDYIRIYERSIHSIVNKNREKFIVTEGVVRLNLANCPNWVNYISFIKKKGRTNMKEIALEYNKRTQEVYIEVMRKKEYINTFKETKNTEIEVKEGLG